MTIIPRGRALGVTHTLPIDERHTYPQSYCEAVLAYALGGRIAEKLVFGEITTGGQQDYRTVTNIARQMVCDWGMSSKLGPIAYGQENDAIFLGREMAQRRDHSDRVAEMIDEEIKSFVLKAESRAERLLSDNIDKVHTLAEALLEFETLDDVQLDQLLAGEELEKPAPRQTGGPNRQKFQKIEAPKNEARQRRHPPKKNTCQNSAQRTPPQKKNSHRTPDFLPLKEMATHCHLFFFP